MRFLTVFLRFASALNAQETLTIADFEAETYGNWQVTGDAFGTGPAQGTLPDQQPLFGVQGKRLVNTFVNRDAGQGTLTSPEFTIDKPCICFRIAGGHRPIEAAIDLIVGGRRVRRSTGDDTAVLRWDSWDVREFIGQRAVLRIFDITGGGWGHIVVDEIIQSDQPRQGFDMSRLEEYRRSPEYMKEPFRPAFHFTPEIHWCNDPNGLVYFDGEYHLFYQYNPWQNVWGFMSWGHAVSPDLVHWQHLPVALHVERDIMAFSGSAVVDQANTSGFGVDGKPPLIAIYTGHGKGKQTQNIAYSNDRGRTWSRYEHNPVLDVDSNEFRDPKVFWHKPTQRWIMVVAMAAQKRVQFYGSKDLKSWEWLSDFGPAGAPNAPNWECPDLFEMAVDNASGESAWVLELGIGSGASAGGSGNQYFLGQFDGTTFTPLEGPEVVRWLDYGRDFYAAVTYSDIPPEDGRRILVGWMNNWETSQNPTEPWRGAMSVPRALTLTKLDGRLTLLQQPVKELEQLRYEHRHLPSFPVSSQDKPSSIGQDGLVELAVELDPGTAREVAVRVRSNGADQFTSVGYDAEKKTVFIDRTKSGNVQFHAAFAGRHEAPLQLRDGKIKLRILVDRTSVEVFANDGEAALTDLIFPDPASIGIEFHAVEGDATIRSVDVWRLKSAVE